MNDAKGVPSGMAGPVSVPAADARRGGMGEAYRMGLIHGQFDSMTQGERMELRVRRMIGQDPVPVRVCVGRRNGKTELLRRAAELMEPGTEDEALRRLQKLMEAAITERVQGVEWASELTPTTLRKVMRKVKAPPPLDPDPVRDRWLRMMLTQAGVIDHNAFVVVTESPEEPMYKGEARPGWMK